MRKYLKGVEIERSLGGQNFWAPFILVGEGK